VSKKIDCVFCRNGNWAKPKCSETVATFLAIRGEGKMPICPEHFKEGMVIRQQAYIEKIKPYIIDNYIAENPLLNFLRNVGII
jgi:hypothetical protein